MASRQASGSMKTPTTRAIVDALEYDLRHQYFTAAVTENTREILERHIKPLVDEIERLKREISIRSRLAEEVIVAKTK